MFKGVLTAEIGFMETKKKLDKDRFRLGLGDVVESYQEIAHRLGVDLT